MTLLLGCVADDFTGATDLANTLVKQGMRTIQLIDVPDPAMSVPDAEATIVALKSRTIAPGEAVGQSVASLRWLRSAGARQFFFKYCSTFDSSEKGNIGPVADALLAELGEGFTIACPAFPTNGRTVYLGHLFVGDVLLSDSGMRNHPLTPMTDSNLMRVLGRQTTGKVGLVPYAVVDKGAEAIRSAFQRLRAEGTRYAIVDALEDRHLLAIGEACSGLRLVTGGSGGAMGLPANFRRQGLLGGDGDAASLPAAKGYAAVLSGSCSPATLGQVEEMKRTRPAFAIDPLSLAEGGDVVARALAWARTKLADGPVLIYGSAPPEEVARAQEKLGRERAGELIEQAMAAIAAGLVRAGLGRLIVAGGETGGAVVRALSIRGLRIGPEIDPGVPWTMSLGGHTPAPIRAPVGAELRAAAADQRSEETGAGLFLALKSGNFGARDFFLKAFEMLA